MDDQRLKKLGGGGCFRELLEENRDTSGYEYQFMECVKNIRDKKIESDSMPLSDSIAIMEIMDGIRRQWGLKYPPEIEFHCS